MDREESQREREREMERFRSHTRQTMYISVGVRERETFRLRWFYLERTRETKWQEHVSDHRCVT